LLIKPARGELARALCAADDIVLGRANQGTRRVSIGRAGEFGVQR
jgi:hypothetical protein